MSEFHNHLSKVLRYNRAPIEAIRAITAQSHSDGAYDKNNNADAVLADFLADHGDPREQIVRQGPAHVRPRARPALEIPLVAQLVVRRENRKARDSDLHRQCATRWDALSRPQQAVEDGPPKSLVDLPVQRHGGAAVDGQE